MFPEKTLRPLVEIQRQYAELCTRAGHIQYQVSAMQKDLDIVNETLREINAEAFAVQKADEDAKVAAAAAAKPEGV